jgi:crotonobetainyl-CoA:carnitine CoA-transferase CaiB-like acyl-CoA transferase
MLQPTRYWPQFCRLFGMDAAAEDPRFASLESLAANADEAVALITAAIGSRTLAECKRLLNEGGGPWAQVQNAWEVANDESLVVNGRIAEVVDAQGNTRKLVASPAQFDDSPADLRRAPMFAEHTDEVLREVGIGEDELLGLKFDGAIT